MQNYILISFNGDVMKNSWIESHARMSSTAIELYVNVDGDFI